MFVKAYILIVFLLFFSVGRHEPIVINRSQSLDVTDLEKRQFKMIFTLQRSELMEKIKSFKISYLYQCCADTIKDLYCNYEEVCLKTKLHYSEWHKERRFRITGSTCYQLFTYTSNKNPDWKKKCDSFFSPKNFRSEYTDYGKKLKGKLGNVLEKLPIKMLLKLD